MTPDGNIHGPQVVIDAGILEVLPEAIKSTKAQTRKEVRACKQILILTV